MSFDFVFFVLAVLVVFWVGMFKGGFGNGVVFAVILILA